MEKRPYSNKSVGFVWLDHMDLFSNMESTTFKVTNTHGHFVPDLGPGPLWNTENCTFWAKNDLKMVITHVVLTGTWIFFHRMELHP